MLKKPILSISAIRMEVAIVALAFLASACTSSQPVRKYAHITDPADVVANLGLESCRDFAKIEDAMAGAGIPYAPRAMSLNAEQIVVERTDFYHAKAFVTGAIIQKKLTARVYETPDTWRPPATSLLEVWENGKKIGEEPDRLY